MTKLKPSYFGHIVRRQASLEKTTLLGEMEGSRETGRPRLTWTGSITEAMGRSPLELGRGCSGQDRALWTSFIPSESHQESELTQ